MFKMSDDLTQSDAFEPWIRLSNWEQQCVDEVEKIPDVDVGFQNEKDIAAQKLWVLFQNAATGIAQLYKDRQHGVSLWVPFQNTASTVTSLYKEGVESQKKFYDMGFQSGYQRKNKELLSWVKKRKRYIQREELIAMLTGRNPPAQRQWTGPRPRIMLDGMRSLAHAHRLQGVEASDRRNMAGDEPNFDIFREALDISSELRNYNSAGVRQHSSGSPSNSFARFHRTRHCTSAAHSELGSYIAEEFTRHVESRKRSPSNDVIMDSPTQKRSRLSSHFF